MNAAAVYLECVKLIESSIEAKSAIKKMKPDIDSMYYI